MENALLSLGLEINEELFPLQQDRIYLVGRGSGDDANNCENFIGLKDKQLDLKHCLLEVTRNKEVYVIDLNSDAGVYLNNQRLQTLTKVGFRFNDIIKLGDNIGKLSQNKADESNESSGFLDVYKNCTIDTSSPKCKQVQNEDYLKSRLSKDTNNSAKTAEISNEENGIDSNFVIPDTQFYKANNSNSSFEKLPNESASGTNAPNRKSPTFFDYTEDEFCVPDTQEIIAPCTTAINNTSVDESLADFGEDETVQLKDASRQSETNEQSCRDANASTHAVTIFESQFRICTQDYNEVTQDEANESQILTLATHNKTADVTATIVEQEITNEISPLNWSVQTDAEKKNALRSGAVTPDLPDLDRITSEENLVNDGNNAVNTNLLGREGDTEDLLETQIFSAPNKIKKIEPQRILIKTVEGQEIHIKEMSNRENIQSELETMQFQTVNFDHNEKDNFKVPNNVNPKALTNSFSAQDEEDDLLTQALLKPTSTPNKGSPPKATEAPDCCRSTLPSGVQPNTMQSFNKLITLPSSKIANSKETPVKSFIALQSSVDSDMDLLQCTPQIINMHINIMEAHNLKINLLKDKWNMTHNDTTEGDETQEDDADNCVTLLKPKASKDFESLLKNVKMSPVKKRDASYNVAKTNKTNRFKILACEPESSKKVKNTKTLNYSKDTKKATDSTKKRKKEISKEVKIYLNRIDNDTSLPSPNKSISNQRQVSTADEVMKSEKMANKPKRHSPSPKTLTSAEDSSEDYVPTQKFTRQTRSRVLHKHSETTADATISAKQIKSGRKREITTDATNEKHFGKRAKRENDTSSTSSAASSTSNNFKRLQITTSMLEPDILKSLLKHSGDLWCIATNPINSQVLVMDKGARTYKFLLAMAKGIPIVTSQWLTKVNEEQKLIPYDDYFLSEPVLEKSHKFSLKKSLQKAGRRRKPLFHGYEFALTSNILPIPQEIQAILECLGGRVHLNGPKAKVATLHLVSCVEDKKDWHNFRRLSKNLVIISTEAIMSAVMQQSLDALSKHFLN